MNWPAFVFVIFIINLAFTLNCLGYFYYHATKATFMKSNLVIKLSCKYINLPYSDRLFNTERQIEMFKRGKPMDMIRV